MVVPNHGIGLIGTRIAIRPVVLYVLPPASQAVQADDQGSHGCHARHQVHRPQPATSPGRTRLSGSRRLSGETLAAQLLRGSGQHGLSPVLVWQRMLVAHGAAWWAGLCRVLVVSLRSLGIVFQAPAGGRLIDRTLVDDPIRITPVRKADGRGSQWVIGYWLLLRRRLGAGMLRNVFFDGRHRYTSSCSWGGRSGLCWLSCCSHCCCLCCRASMYSLSTCWCRARRLPWCHCTCAIKVRMVSRLSGSSCRSSLPARFSQLSTCCHWSSAQSRSWMARLSQKTVWCQRARSRSWAAQVECWSA